VGIGYHSNHFWFAPEGSLFPAEAGTYVTGYMTDEGLENLSNITSGSSNKILIDLEGTPSFDLPSTEESEGAEIDTVKTHVREVLLAADSGTATVTDRGETPSVEFLRADLEGAQKSFPAVTAMLVIVASITIILSLQRLIQSQSREIAIMRTLGVPRNSVMVGYMLAPLVIGLIGSAIGVLLGVFFGIRAMLDIYENVIGLPILHETLDWNMVLEIVIIAIVIVLLSGLRPAWTASRLKPLDILGGQHEVRVGSKFLQNMTASLPTTIGLTIRSSMRKPVRLSLTFIAVGLSMLIYGTMLMFSGSMVDILVDNLEEGQQWDVQAEIPEGGPEGIIAWSNEHNATYELVIEYPFGTIKDDTGKSKPFTAVGLDNFDTEGSSMRLVNLIDGELPVKETQVLADEGTAALLEWKLNEKRTLKLGTMEINVELVGTTRGEISRTIYFHRTFLEEEIGIEATSVYLKLENGDSVDGDLADVSQGLTEKQNLLSGMEQLLEQQSQFLGVFIFLGILVAAAVLFNTLVMNLAERDLELSTLRVLGGSTTSLGAMIIGENFVIGLVGGIFGAIFAYFGTVYMAAEFSSWTFYITVIPSVDVVLFLIATVLIISLAITPYGIWRLRRMDLVEKVKDFSN
jgi:putative ABC transport system permease protein